ncbi:DUF6958 family protein [Jiulongibacter sp. NS-SX5]|uniref:DUF6958 family protein n=1 Tax=Jiulongibacter sp. NS-SX5 TaxID=3463854 RepID=UPI0040599781
MSDKILTLHPEGKKGVNISLEKYILIKDYILRALEEEGAMTYQYLNDKAKKDLTDNFSGSVPWYVVSVKLDLEARGLIERIPKTSPHQIRLKKT